jgi:hypothetical protein
MPESPPTKIINRGYCDKCCRIVPVQRLQRGNEIYLTRTCSTCGYRETRISGDARAYYKKRELCGYVEDAKSTCSMDCVHCRHGVVPKLVVIDVTNHCNMNCPICLANIPGMGFDFHPPIGYFEKIFQHLNKFSPKPRVQMFGGEPTCREDFIEILQMAKRYKLECRIVTNGMRLADEQYCKEMLATNPRLLFGLDGLNPEVQRKLRKNPGSLNVKLKAIENIEKYTQSQIILMVTCGVGVSEELMPGLMQFCHEKKNLIYIMTLIPLQSTVGPEVVDIQTSTVEDVENLMGQCFPGLEFIPVGSLRLLDTFQKIFNTRITLGGAHPSCETVTLMIADEKAYHPVNEYLKAPLYDVVKNLIAWDQRMGPKVERGLLGRLFGKTGRRMHYVLAGLPLVRRSVRVGKVLGPKPVRRLLKILWTKIRTGESWKAAAGRHIAVRAVLQIYILPYEEVGCVEAARLVDCPIAFGCESPETGEVITIPFCSYFVYKNDILRKTSERWGVMGANGEAEPAVAASVAAGSK